MSERNAQHGVMTDRNVGDETSVSWHVGNDSALNAIIAFHSSVYKVTVNNVFSVRSNQPAVLSCCDANHLNSPEVLETLLLVIFS